MISNNKIMSRTRFEFTTNHIKSLKNYEVDYIKNPQNFITLLQEEVENSKKQALDNFHYWEMMSK